MRGRGLFVGVLSLGFLSGCLGNLPLIGKKAKVPVRPAANADGDESPPPRFFRPPIALATPEDAIVRVLVRGRQVTCSGTLVEDDLVLTAHHCVVERGKAGEYTKGILAAKDVGVELGGDYLAWGSVGVKHVVTPPCGESGGVGDLAVLVLERKLVGLATMTPRLDGAPKVGEPLEPAGFGRCALSADGIHRAIRPGGTVTKIRGGIVELDASICPGDSGGPLLARGGHEVVGVVSQSAMDGDERTRSASVAARIDLFRMVFSNARLIADGMSPSEVPPLTCDR
jgi:V8-like Glu-specific endopeptidase